MWNSESISTVRFQWLAGITAWVYILSVLDGIMTIIWVLGDFAEEANPLMGMLIARDPVIFMAVKILLVSLGITLLWRLRARPLAVFGIFVCFIVYCSIMLHHLSAAGRIVTAALLQSAPYYTT